MFQRDGQRHAVVLQKIPVEVPLVFKNQFHVLGRGGEDGFHYIFANSENAGLPCMHRKMFISANTSLAQYVAIRSILLSTQYTWPTCDPSMSSLGDGIPKACAIADSEAELNPPIFHISWVSRLVISQGFFP